jgi:hypothetical protein
MATLDPDDDSGDIAPEFTLEELERSQVETRKAKNREKQKRFRAQKADRLSQLHASSCVDEALLLECAMIGRKKSMDSYDRQTQKITAEAAKRIALYALIELKDLELPVQNLVLKKTFGHILLQGFLPDYLKDLQAVKHNQLVLGNINSGMTSHFTGVHPSHSLMAKDIICTLALSQSLGTSRGLAKVLGIGRRNIKKAIMRRVLLDTRKDSSWTSYKRATRSDVLPESVWTLVNNWWTNESTISPERKRVL